MNSQTQNNQTPRTVAITGSTGLLGTGLAAFLSGRGHTIRPVVRSQPKAGEIEWSVADETIDAHALVGVDTVVHLAGESLFGLWTEAKKRRILESRVQGTGLIARTIAGLDDGPKTLICASAVGYYGDRGDELLDESSSPGDDFLAEVVKQWEAAADPAREAGVRVVHMRAGVFLTTRGGALPKMLPAFRMGVGGKLGKGDQYFAWVAFDDVVRAFHHAMITEQLHGPVNVVAPDRVTNEQFTETLGEVLHRPTFMTVPAFALKAIFGEMGESTLLSGQCVASRRLLDSGFTFEFGLLEPALRHVLGKTPHAPLQTTPAE
jgi:uncharacterized protein (TIGR01777 family)